MNRKKATPNRHQQKGIAIVIVLVMIVVVTALLSVSSLLSLGNRKTTADTILSAQAQYVAEAAIEVALKRTYWDPYTAWKASTDSALKTPTGKPVEFDNCAFKKFLTGYDKNATPTQLASNNASECPYSLFPAAVPAASNPLSALVNNAKITLTDSSTGSIALTGSKYSITIERRDTPNGETELYMDVTGQVVDSTGKVQAERRLSRVIKISGDVYEGDKFAMLATAANCSFCHLQVDTMQRAFSTSGTFDRARVGFTLANPDTKLDFAEKAKPDVVIYGGMYVRTGLNKIQTRGYADGQFARYAAQSNGFVKAGANSNWLPTGKFFSGTTGPSGDFKFNGSAETATNSFAWDAATAFNGSNNGGANRGNGIFYYNYPSEAEVKGTAGLARDGSVILDTDTAKIAANKALYNGKWPDGALPDTFPAAIAGGEDGVSDTEWNNFVAGNVGGKVNNSDSAYNTANEPRIYGVRRPSSSKIDTDIPWSYNPVVANNITDTRNVYTAADIAANQNNYQRWIITQALASPNNRDFLPTNADAATTPFNTVGSDGVFGNNFYVNYRGTTLALAYCTKATGAFNDLQTCARGAYDGFDNFVGRAANNLSSLSIAAAQTVWFPQVSNSALKDLVSGTKSGKTGYFDGNLIIDAGTLGNSTKPLNISGTIMVNGDLVIRGKIRGAGRIVARGNIYIVGDLVYACKDDGTLCSTTDYGNASAELGRLALLAGGNIIVGDYDAPDSRVANNRTVGSVSTVQGDQNRASDLLNDQTGRNATPSATMRWDYFNVPGSTGRPARNTVNASGGWINSAADADVYASVNAGQLSATNPNSGAAGFDGRGGFMTRLSNVPNGRGSIQKVVYKVSPFGYMLSNGNGSDNTPETYESGSGFYNGTLNGTSFEVGKTVNPVYPSNGPIRTGEGGNSATKGVVTSSGGIGCSTAASTLAARRFIFSPVTSGINAVPNNNVPRAPFQFGYWCTPNTSTSGETYVRRDGGTAVTGSATNPSGNIASWMQANANDKALDGGNGLTTGWLGGLLLDKDGKTVLGDLSQTRLLKLMWLSGMETNSRARGPLRTNGVFYSANAIVNLLRAGIDGRASAAAATQSNMQSRWIHVGSVIASELAFLTSASAGGDTSGMHFTVNRSTVMDFSPASNAPSDLEGSWGSGLSILYDNRLQGLLQISTGVELKIRRTGTYAQVKVAR